MSAFRRQRPYSFYMHLRTFKRTAVSHVNAKLMHDKSILFKVLPEGGGILTLSLCSYRQIEHHE